MCRHPPPRRTFKDSSGTHPIALKGLKYVGCVKIVVDALRYRLPAAQMTSHGYRIPRGTSYRTSYCASLLDLIRKRNRHQDWKAFTYQRQPDVEAGSSYIAANALPDAEGSPTDYLPGDELNRHREHVTKWEGSGISCGASGFGSWLIPFAQASEMCNFNKADMTLEQEGDNKVKSHPPHF